MSSNNTFRISHPLIEHGICLLRDKNTDSSAFRRKMHELSRMIAYEATRDLPLTQVEIETPLEKCMALKVTDRPIIVSIMRAGNGMIDALLQTMPFASAGHIGIYRDKFINNTVEYYFKLPSNPEGRTVFLADPLLATGDTILASIERLKQYNVGEIRILNILSSQYGIDRVHHFYPDVKIYTGSIEKSMNDHGYLLPGLGDAGDRLYNTL